MDLTLQGHLTFDDEACMERVVATEGLDEAAVDAVEECARREGLSLLFDGDHSIPGMAALDFVDWLEEVVEVASGGFVDVTVDGERSRWMGGNSDSGADHSAE